jgi:hypothetical protein
MGLWSYFALAAVSLSLYAFESSVALIAPTSTDADPLVDPAPPSLSHPAALSEMMIYA